MPKHDSGSKPNTHSFKPAQFVSGEKVCRTFIFLQFMCTSKAMFSKPWVLRKIWLPKLKPGDISVLISDLAKLHLYQELQELNLPGKPKCIWHFLWLILKVDCNTLDEIFFLIPLHFLSCRFTRLMLQLLCSSSCQQRPTISMWKPWKDKQSGSSSGNWHSHPGTVWCDSCRSLNWRKMLLLFAKSEDCG